MPFGQTFPIMNVAEPLVALLVGASGTSTRFGTMGIAALGIAGAANWRADGDAQNLEGIERIYIVIEAGSRRRSSPSVETSGLARI